MKQEPQSPRVAHNLVFFGIGVSFTDCFQQLALALGRKPNFLCDNSTEKWGAAFWDVPCISPAELSRLKGDTVVVITVRRYEQIYQQLRQLGLEEIFVACFDQGYDIVSDIKKINSIQLEQTERTTVTIVQGRWTFITGASRGIGRQIAMGMAEQGSNLIVHSRHLDHLDEVSEVCSAFGVQVKPIIAELSDETEVEHMLNRLSKHYPPIDIVFNNAGISLPPSAGTWDISGSEYKTHFAVNTLAPIRICYRLIPAMIGRGYGRVVNVSSTIQKRPGELAYACSKAALNKFVHDLAPSLAGTGVMISLACPGYVQSDMGGTTAPHPVESVIPGVLLGALLDEDCNGRWFIAQDYAGMDLAIAAAKAKFYYSMDRED